MCGQLCAWVKAREFMGGIFLHPSVSLEVNVHFQRGLLSHFDIFGGKQNILGKHLQFYWSSASYGEI